MKKSNILLSVMFVVCLVVPLMISCFYIKMNEKILYIGNYLEYNNANNSYIFIDSITCDEKYWYIEGCGMQLGMNLEYINSCYVLIDEDGNMYRISTICGKYREGATWYFNDGYNYDFCNMIGQFPVGKLENKKYKIGVIFFDESGKGKLAISYFTFEGEAK